LPLCVGAIFSIRVAARLGSGNPAYGAWALFSWSMVILAVAQSSLAYREIFLHERPFPSIADAIFMLYYPVVIPALIAFRRAYKAAGLLDARSTQMLGAVLYLVAAGVCTIVVVPVVRSNSAPLEKVLNVCYPAGDLIILVPTLLLLRSMRQL